MKTFSCIILCSLLIVGAMVFADEWYGIHGYVFDDGDPVMDAEVRLWEHPGGGSESVYTDEYGHYHHWCPAGTYGMEAIKGSKNDLQFPIYYNGGIPAKRVDFELTYDVK